MICSFTFKKLFCLIDYTMNSRQFDHLNRIPISRPHPQQAYTRQRYDMNKQNIKYVVHNGRRLPALVTLPPGTKYDSRPSHLNVNAAYHTPKQQNPRYLVQQPINRRLVVNPLFNNNGTMTSPRSERIATASPQRSHQETIVSSSQTLSVDSGLSVSYEELASPGLNGENTRDTSSLGVEREDVDSGRTLRKPSVSKRDKRRRSKEIRRANTRRKSVYDPRGAYGSNANDNVLDIYKEEDDMMGEDIPVLERIKIQKERIAEVRLQPLHMKNKLDVVRKARSFVETYEGKLSRSQGYQQKGAQIWKKINREVSNVITALLPWEMRIKRIESHFGSVVASYFVFLRWMIWINVWLTLLPLCFIIIPEMVSGSPHGSQGRKRVPEDQEGTASDLKTIWDAEGLLKYSPVFYGYYGAEEKIGVWYRLPLAYLLTGIAAFAFSFIMVLRKMAANARGKRQTSGDEQFTFSWKLFTEWDCTIGNPETASNKRAAMVTIFRECILEEQEKVKEVNVCLTRFLRLVSNFIVLVLLGVSTFVIQLCVEQSREFDLKKKTGETNFWEENQLTIVMTIISAIFPNIFELIASMEKYHPRITLRLQLARIFALNLLNIYTLFFALFNKQNDMNKDLELSNACLGTTTPLDILNTTQPWNTTVSSTRSTYLENTTTSSKNCSNEAETICWETMVGQEVFKLTIMDTIFMVGQIIIQDFLRGLFVRYCNPYCCWDMEKQFPEYGDFKTPENLLHLINNQGMIWLGAFFAPGLPILNMLKLLLLVYIRCWSVMACNVPQDRIFRASRSNNFYFAILLMMLFLSMPPSMFAIAGATPSPQCGPFSGQDKMFTVLTNTIEKELPSKVSTVLGYIATPGVIITVMLLLGLVIYYLASVSRSLKDANSELKMQLQYERTDGRKKVYAMADAKREMETGSGTLDAVPSAKGSGNKKKLAKDIGASVMAAARMGRMLSSANGKLPNGARNRNNGSKNPPIAVVQGKKTESPITKGVTKGHDESEDKATDMEQAQKILTRLFSQRSGNPPKVAIKEDSRQEEIVSNLINSNKTHNWNRENNEQSGNRNNDPPTTVIVHHPDTEDSTTGENRLRQQCAETTFGARTNVPKVSIPPKPTKTIQKSVYVNEYSAGSNQGIQNPSYLSDGEEEYGQTSLPVRRSGFSQAPAHHRNDFSAGSPLSSAVIHRPILSERIARAGNMSKN